MTLDEQIAGVFRTNATLCAVFGGRAYHAVPAEDPGSPFVVWQEITAEPTPTFDSFGEDLVFFEYQFSCWARTANAAKGIRRTLAPILAAAFSEAFAQSIGSTIVDPTTGLHQAILQIRIPSTL
jgi:hypothetical protein